MLELCNDSPWAARLFPGWDRERREVMTCVLKARYRFDASGRLELGDAPSIEAVDRHGGDPLRSSLVRASEGVPFKAGGEWLAHGTAMPQRPEQRARLVTVTLATPRDTWTKSLQVTGRRCWQRTLFGLVPGPAEPLAPTPLCYELAFGGVDTEGRALEPRNPIGMGLHASRQTAADAELPRVEPAGTALTRWSQRPEPGGFGPIPPGWQPRRALAADIDEEAAAAGRCPYPEPVPEPLFNAAPEDQRLPDAFRGGELLTLDGFGLAGPTPVTIIVPAFRPPVRLVTADGAAALATVCDTLVMDADEGTLDLVARASVACPRVDPVAGWLVVSDPEAAAA